MQQRTAGTGILAVVAVIAASSIVHGQGLGDRLKKRADDAAKRTVEQRVDKKTSDATNAARDKAKNSVKCATSDKACHDKAKADRKSVVIDDSAPKRFGEGNMEVAQWQGRRAIPPRHDLTRKFAIPLNEQLPERFTLEIDVTPPHGNNWVIIKFADTATDNVRFRVYGGKGMGRASTSIPEAIASVRRAPRH